MLDYHSNGVNQILKLCYFLISFWGELQKKMLKDSEENYKHNHSNFNEQTLIVERNLMLL
jgi:hypothetical protein